MKIGIFTDSHYSSAEVTCGNRYNNKSLGKIKESLAYFQENNCDLVVCLGDLIDREKEHKKEIDNLKEVSDALSEFHIKTYVLMGNHDAFAFEKEEFYSVLGDKYIPKDIFSKENKNLLFLDTCYFKSGVRYMPGDTKWEDTFFPETDQLSKTLSEIAGDTYIFLHHNIDPDIREDHRVFNHAEVREILEKNGKVRTVFQGHYHPGYNSEQNGIRYATFSAMCENEQAYYIVEI